MYNEFEILGPKLDPAGIQGLRKQIASRRRIIDDQRSRRFERVVVVMGMTHEHTFHLDPSGEATRVPLTPSYRRAGLCSSRCRNMLQRGQVAVIVVKIRSQRFKESRRRYESV